MVSEFSRRIRFRKLSFRQAWRLTGIGRHTEGTRHDELVDNTKIFSIRLPHFCSFCHHPSEHLGSVSLECTSGASRSPFPDDLQLLEASYQAHQS